MMQGEGKWNSCYIPCFPKPILCYFYRYLKPKIRKNVKKKKKKTFLIIFFF